MKKNTLFNVIIISLLIIMGISIITAGFMIGIVEGLVAIAFMSLVYALILTIAREHY